MVVVLPAPLGPRTPYTDPVGTARSTPSTARVVPNALTRPDVSTAGVDRNVNVASSRAPPGAGCGAAGVAERRRLRRASRA